MGLESELVGLTRAALVCGVEAHTARAHAILAPSSASRWMACPGSVQASVGIERRASIFADEGTGAHTLGELCLRKDVDADVYEDSFVDITADKDNPIVDAPGDGRFPIDDEMIEGVQLYLDFCRDLFEKSDVHFIEQRLSMEHVHEGIFGTGDVIAYQSASAHLHVVDLKYGKGVAVEPKENAQALCYGVGAANFLIGQGLPVRKVSLHIVQSRAPHRDGPIRSWETYVEGLEDFAKKLRFAARATQYKNPKLVAGDHCRFCPASPTCPERKKVALEQARIEFDVAGVIKTPVLKTVSSAELGGMLGVIDQVETWCKRVREYAYDEATHGRAPEGWKLVDKRANRKWKAEGDTVKGLLGLGVPHEDIYTAKIISPAQADKLVGKKGAEQLKPLWEKVSSGSTLAPVSDPRPVIGTDARLEFSS